MTGQEKTEETRQQEEEERESQWRDFCELNAWEIKKILSKGERSKKECEVLMGMSEREFEEFLACVTEIIPTLYEDDNEMLGVY